nr:immunoglobulin heavy chain junction region [Macaca mulatta]
CARGAYFDQW